MTAWQQIILMPIAAVLCLLLGLGLVGSTGIYGQPTDPESGVVVDEIDLPEYDFPLDAGVGADETKAIDSQIVEVEDDILENVQFRNYTLDLDVLTYFNCVSDASLPLYELYGEDFRSESPILYIHNMEVCLGEQLSLTE